MRQLDREFKRRMEVAEEVKIAKTTVPLIKGLNYQDLVAKSAENDALKETVKR